jgi:hypothetical protein
MRVNRTDYRKGVINPATMFFTRLRSWEAPKNNESLFSLLLGIESRLRADAPNNQIKQPKRSKLGNRSALRASYPSRYCE